MADEDSDEKKYVMEQGNDNENYEDEVIFGGQVPRAATQVTGLTNIEKAKTLMTLSTAKVQTKPTGHSKPSPYVPDSDLFKFSNPDRPDDDLEIANNQIYNEPVNVTHSNPNMISSNPTFTRPTAARQHGNAGNAIQQKYAHHLTFKGDNSTQILFGRFTNKSSCCLLVCSAILSLLFCYVAIVFFPKFGSADCNEICSHSEVPNRAIKGIMNKEITIISGCDNNFLMFSIVGSSMSNIYTFEQLSEMESSDISSMYVGGVDVKSPNEIECWEKINAADDEIMSGYVYIDSDEYIWDWTATGWYLILSIMMALFFILIEWLFYSYNEIMIPRKDYRSYVMWYLIRIGWMSFMFTIIISHSLLISDSGDIIYMIGSFDYIWVKANCFIATGFIGLFILICLCCCCFQESDGFSGGNPFSSNSNPDDFGFERYFLPKSRIDLRVINDFEQGLGTAMCTTMIFIIAFIICGFVPFIEFLNAGLSGYTYFAYIASIWFLAMIVMTFQMCWFVRAKCCGDDDDKRRAQLHDRQIQRAGTVP